MKFLEYIFSVKNECNHKIVRILGLKFKSNSSFNTLIEEKLSILEQNQTYLKKYIESNVNNQGTNKALSDILTMQFINERMLNILLSGFVQNLHKKTFLPFKDKHLNQDIVIFATGPTLKFYENINNAIQIGVNKTFLQNNLKLDYLFMQDYKAVRDYISKAEEYDCQKFYGTFLDGPTDDYISIPSEIAEKHKALRYYNAFPDKRIFKNILKHPLFDSGSITFPAINFALYCNPKRIFLVGCDCSNCGYFDNTKQAIRLPENDLLDGYNKVKEFVSLYYPETEIISVNPVGLKGVFKDVYTKSYLKEKPEINSDKVEILEV